MKTILNKNDLVEFENEIADLFNNKMIKAPIHLDQGCEEQLLEIFKEIDETDFICCSWRSHYRALLKNLSPDILKKYILEGRSISICDKEHNIFSSAIVSGNVSIGLGIAMAYKQNKEKRPDGTDKRVWCFIGEMTSCHGSFFECLTYAENFKLPITYIVEDNGKSVKTPTREVIGNNKLPFEPQLFDDDGDTLEDFENGKVIRSSSHLYWFKYSFEKWQHSGTNTRIQF